MAGLSKPFTPCVSPLYILSDHMQRERDRTHIEVTPGFSGANQKESCLCFKCCPLIKNGTSVDWAWRTLLLFAIFYIHVLKIRNNQEIWPHEFVSCCIWIVQKAKIEEHWPVNLGPNLLIHKWDIWWRHQWLLLPFHKHRHSLNLMSVSYLARQQTVLLNRKWNKVNTVCQITSSCFFSKEKLFWQLVL